MKGPVNDESRGSVVLIVEDDPLFRWALSETLSAESFHVVVAEGGATALACLSSQPHIDIMLLDVELPDHMGLVLLRSLRALHPECAVVLVTAYGGTETIVLSHIAAPCRVLTKPCDLGDVVGTVSELAHVAH